MADVEEINRKRKQEKEEKERKKQEQEELLKRQKEEEKHKQLLKERRKRRRLIPSFVMLTVGAIVSVTMLLLQYNLKRMLPILLVVLIVFYIVGELIKYMFDTFADQNEKKEAAEREGEVIEKQLEQTEQAEQTE